jgi:hypothetical protein
MHSNEFYRDEESDLNNTLGNGNPYSAPSSPEIPKCYYCNKESNFKYSIKSYVYTPDPFGKFLLKDKKGKIKIDKNGKIKKFNCEYVEKHFCNNCKLGSRYNESDKKFVNKKILKQNINKQNVNIDIINFNLLKLKI